MARVTLYILENVLLPILTRVVGRCNRYVRSRESSDSIFIEKFIFSEDSSDLSPQEYAAALNLIDWVKTLILLRDSKMSAMSADDVSLPGANWNRRRAQHFEIDGKVTNMFTSSDLVLSGDFNVVRKLRLYSQAFTGYQLATLEFNHLRPWIRKPLPENVDDFLRLIAVGLDDFSRRIPGIFRKLPERLRISPPLKFGEIGWQVDGRVLNYDTYSYLVELCLMHENGVLQAIESNSNRRPFRVLEIGGGFGGFAYHLMRLHANVHYAIVDIPESLLFSSIYLTTLFPNLPHVEIKDEHGFELADKPGFTFIPNFLMDGLSKHSEKFDLIINMLSLSEMTENQVIYYSKKIKELLSPTGIVFEDNFISGHQVKDLRMILEDYSSCKYIRCRTSILHGASFRGRARIWRPA